jgi:hypothetical protein
MVQTPDFTMQPVKEKELKSIQAKKNKRPIDRLHEERAVFGKGNKIRNSMRPDSETPFVPTNPFGFEWPADTSRTQTSSSSRGYRRLDREDHLSIQEFADVLDTRLDKLECESFETSTHGEVDGGVSVITTESSGDSTKQSGSEGNDSQYSHYSREDKARQVDSSGEDGGDTSEVMDQTHCAVESDPHTLVMDHHHDSEDSSLGLQNDSVNLEEKGGQISNENDTTLIYDLAAALNTQGVQQGIANDERMKAAVARHITQEKMDAYIARRVQEYGPDVFSKVSSTGTCPNGKSYDIFVEAKLNKERLELYRVYDENEWDKPGFAWTRILDTTKKNYYIKSAAAIELEADKNLSQPKAIARAKNAQQTLKGVQTLYSRLQKAKRKNELAQHERALYNILNNFKRTHYP